jgi:hypothetical protein
MNSRRHRVFGLLASTVTTAVLAASMAGAANAGDGSVGTSSPERPNPILLNDIAHFGTPGRQLSAPGTPIVVRVDGGFDWAAAGVGAVGGLGFVLVAGVAASALRSRRRVGAART